MSEDIVMLLRAGKANGCPCRVCSLLSDAAETIERLRNALREECDLAICVTNQSNDWRDKWDALRENK